MVFTLTAAMLVGTPMTASAAGLVDLYKIEDGWGNVVGNNDVSRTGTVTATETNSGVLSAEGILQGIGLSETKVEINTDEIETEDDYPELTAYLEWDGAINQELADALVKSLKWRSSDTQIVAVKVPNGSYDGGSRETIKLIPKASGTADVTVSLDSDRYNLHYSATAAVTVVQYADGLKFEVPSEDTVTGNVLTLNDYVQTLVDGKAVKTADKITYALIDNGNGAATLKNGILTLKKVTAADRPVKVKAMGKKAAAQAVAVISVTQGVNATKLKFEGTGVKGTTLTQLANDGLEATVTATVAGKKGGTGYCTDKITWSSAKPEIVEVTSPKGAAKFDNDKCAVQLKFKSAGNTQIIGKTSAGKSFKLTVKVSAELTGVKLNEGKTLYTGQIIDLNDYVKLKEYKEKADSSNFKTDGLVKWEFTDKSMKSLAKLNAKTGALQILPDLNKKGTPTEKKITVKAVNAKKNKSKTFVSGGNEVTFELKQVNISKIIITQGKNTNNENAFVSIESGNKQTPKSANDSISVDRTKSYGLYAEGTIGESTETVDVTDALAWTASGNGKTIKAVKDGRIGSLTALKKGSATITASGVTKNKGKYVAIKATFKSKVNAPTKTIALSVKNTGIAATTGKNQNITIKATLDKGTTTKASDIKWIVAKNGETIANKAKFTLTKDTYKAGDKITVRAIVPNGPSATITLAVVKPSKSVVFKNVTKNKVEFASATAEAQTIEAKVLLADADKTELTPGADNAAKVTYTMNKDGVVRIVESKADGKITISPLTKGKVTITARTSDGKTGKLSVTVK